ncbi:MAG: alpha/beta fold hydrolase [Leptolyngbyaceae cyanobacterium SL_7_1]|nr:alpha/beta fold hydrolase [Leptolyngbyaceae cyanobacterium SL_7_1]
MTSAPQHVYFRTPRKTRPELPLFVFLPGMDGTGDLLQAQTEGLEQAFDVRCLAIPPDDLTNWDDLVEQVTALIRLELEGDGDRKIYLCGESFGGCLAIKVALRSPRLFHRIILINPASSFKRRSLIHWGSYLTYALPEAFYRMSCILLLPFLTAIERIELQERQALLKAMQSVSQRSAVWRLALLREFEVGDGEWQYLTQPVLVIVGRCDRLLPSTAEAEFLVDHLPNAQMHLLPKSGHACLLETGINLHEILEAADFLDTPNVAPIEPSSLMV